MIGGAVYRARRALPGARFPSTLGGGDLPRMLLALLLAASAARADEIEKLAPLAVTAARGAHARDELPVNVTVFTAAQLTGAPDLALDDVLRADPAFSLFRRTGSLLAHPTAQGVSLRGIGPSGASRSLVLLDGVPLNDPFGGWVTWSKVPRLSLASAEIMRGGGSGVWGNGALGGTVSLITTPPASARRLRLAAEAGSFGTRRGELGLTVPAGRNGAALRLDARAFDTDGTYSLAAASRGTVDRPLDSMHRLVQAGWRQPLARGLTGTLTARWFEEERGNGTPLQRNRTREAFASFALEGEPRPDFAWQALAYGQGGSLASYFTGVNAARSAETPANDQFDVPSTAAGAALTFVRRDGDARSTAGLDVRAVRGETREDFLFTAGRFTRRRFAGGAQTLAGVFAHHDRPLTAQVRASLDLRLDRWENRGGHRRELDLVTGAATRDETYADGFGWAFSPGAGVVWHPAEAVRVRGAVYRAFRQPTLNEYYRPFRVGNVSTEANPALALETLHGAEAGVEWTAGGLRLELGGFVTELADAVGNITLSRTPTAVSRQRQNLETVRVRGAEFSATWTPRSGLVLRADYLLNDARVAAAGAQPALVGRRLAQVPRHTFCAGAEAALPFDVHATAQLRRISVQFEDDENLLPLAAATTVDLRLARRFGPRTEVSIAVENLFDATVETSRSADGLVTRDTGRWVRAGLRVDW